MHKHVFMTARAPARLVEQTRAAGFEPFDGGRRSGTFKAT